MSKSSGDDRRFNPGRRKLLAGIAGGGAAAALAACGSSSAPDDGTSSLPALPDPKGIGIDHVVVVMMENRSFDHYYGWLPGANGKQAGLRFLDKKGQVQSSHHLTDFQNCDLTDPDHSYAGGRTQLNNGAMDGFLQTQPAGDTFPIGYYEEADLPFHGPAARNWTVCDHYHCGILSSTFPNRVYMHAGQTDRNSNTFDISSLPTVWDRMASVGGSASYYFGDLPMTALWGAAYLAITKPFATFLADAALGNLANLSFIDPTFLGEGNGVSHDDHPLADIRNGQAFLNQIYNALRTSPQWDKTLLIVNYDEWGGFFDHVVPPLGPVTDQEKAATGNDGRLGFRVPVVLAGPRARRGQVESLPLDPNSILNFLAWRFGFEPLGARVNSVNLAHALDLVNPPDTSAPAFDVPAGPFGQACGLPSLAAGTSINELDEAQRRQAEHVLEWQGLKTLAKRHGFAV
jgi:phospholipase C